MQPESLPSEPPGKPQIDTSGGGGLVAKSCPTLVTPWTVALPGSSVRGISQASTHKK